MRPRIAAASAAALIAAASFAPTAARAAGQNTIFVNNLTSACTDSGTGTFAAPYCTLQAAADAANPGDVVDVTPSTYAAATITRSGTASAPITFTGNGGWSSLGVGRAAAAPLSISGASHLKIIDFRLTPGSTADAVVDGGSDITFDNDSFNSPSSAAAEPALHITNGASAVTVQDSMVSSEILVDGGSTGTVVTTNRISASVTNPISVVGAANTALTSNTINGCGPSISITGSATGTSVENNVINSPGAGVSSGCPASAQAYGILVDSASASATTEDYNDVFAPGVGAAPYDWAGTAYSSAAGLFGVAAQAQHDDNSVLGVDIVEHSPLIDSANSAAVGEQAVDFLGLPRVADPVVTATGTGPHDYYDRGVSEFQDPRSVVTASFTSSATKAPVGAAITLHAAVTDTWSDTFDYQFALGNGTTVDGGTSGTANVSFGTPGSYSVTLYVIPTNSVFTTKTYEGSLYITIAPQAPLVPQVSMSANGAYGVSVDDNGTTDAWAVSSVTFDFGDKTSAQTVADEVTVQHTYAKAGTYTITETVTDQGGNSAKTSAAFTTNALAPGTLINMGGGLTTFVPAKSTGIVQASTTSMPNDSSQLVAATAGGTVEFATGTSHGNIWQAWQPLSQPGVTVKWVGIAGMPNGSSQLIEVTSAGTLLHTIRNANGTWQAGWGSPAGSTGFTHAAITDMPDGSAQLVAVTAAGVLMHDIRFANGSWQGWRALSQPGVRIVDASIAGLPDGSAQIVEATSTGVMKHDIRYPGGSWQGWGVPAGATGITQVSIGSTSVFGSIYGPGTTIISAVTSQGGQVYVFRNAGGSWSDWWGTRSGIGTLGTAANATVSTLPDGSYLMFTVSGG